MPSKDALQRLIDGLQTLIREHLALARAEIKDDLRVMGRDLLVGASGVPALAAGYLLLMVAIGYLLGVWLPLWAAFGIVAVVNLGVGGAVSLAGLRKIMRQRVGMPRTGEELQRDKVWLASLKERPQPVSPVVERGTPMRRSAPLHDVPDTGAGPARPPYSQAVPAGKSGSTAGATGSLSPRSPDSQRRQPEPGATTPPDGASSVH